MDTQLKASFSDDERAHAAELGDDDAHSLEDQVGHLFDFLQDPLLSAKDVKQLLGTKATAAKVRAALDALVAAESLEKDSETQRPFDRAGTDLYRRADGEIARLRLTAIEEEIADNQTRLLFPVEGRLVRSVARVDRLDAISGEGVQREEIKKHVTAIAESVTKGTFIPSPILLVLLSENVVEPDTDEDGDELRESMIVVRSLTEFTAAEEPGNEAGPVAQRARVVELDLPFRRASFDSEKSILLVDGQQRTAALSRVSVDDVAQCPLPVCAIVADAEEAKNIFRLANKTVPIKTEFARALSADMKGAGYVPHESIPASVCRDLGGTEQASPLYDLVKFPLVKGPKKPVAYNTLFEIVQEFYEDPVLDLKDEDDLRDALLKAFTIIKATWPSAWGVIPSSEARLMGGAGLRAVAGLLRHKLTVQIETGKSLDDAWSPVEQSFENLTAVVAWTQVDALQGNATIKENWNMISALQNTPQDLRKLRARLRQQSLKADGIGN